MYAVYLRCPKFFEVVGKQPAWMNWTFNDNRRALMAAVDGKGEFAFHTQLKLSLGALCSAEAEAERALHDTLSARLAALVALRSLCPGGRVLPGVLREGSMPGWLPLLLDTPPGLVLLRVPMMGPLLRLVRARARARASPSPSTSPNP